MIITPRSIQVGTKHEKCFKIEIQKYPQLNFDIAYKIFLKGFQKSYHRKIYTGRTWAPLFRRWARAQRRISLNCVSKIMGELSFARAIFPQEHAKQVSCTNVQRSPWGPNSPIRFRRGASNSANTNMLLMIHWTRNPSTRSMQRIVPAGTSSICVLKFAIIPNPPVRDIILITGSGFVAIRGRIKGPQLGSRTR
jgi:hypothetical protein